MPNLKAIFYPANNGTNLQAIRNTNYNHVFLGHGDSNKTSSANKVFRLYDEVWVAGHAHLDRFKRIPGNYSGIDFKVIGQPWMRDWLAALPDYSQSERKDWGYFPTWRGYYANTNYSSLDLTPEIVKVAQDCLSGSGFLKLHPWSSQSDVRSVEEIVSNFSQRQSQEDGDADEVSDPPLILPKKSMQLREVLEKPLRFVVCDISASVTECLYVNVPIFLFYPSPPALVAPDFEEQNKFCYLFRDAQELKALLQRVITEGDDYLAERREEAVNYFVDLERTKSGRVYEELDRLPKISA